MSDTRFNCLPTMIGSMPQIDPVKACALVARFLPDIPAWPQLPHRTFNEDMNAQYSEGFPGIMLKNKRVLVDSSADIGNLLEKLYSDYTERNALPYKTTSEHASGLYGIKSSGIRPVAVKGQVVGPVTWGLSVQDETKRPIIYNDIFADAVPKFLQLKAAWQEKFLSGISSKTIIFLDEPYMVSVGSATFTLTREHIITLINEVFQGIKGLKGIHCCGNTDWPILLETNTDIISYDTYNFAESLALFPEKVKRFLARGGAIAWGIVPNTQESLEKETVASLKDRFEGVLTLFIKKGIARKQLIEHSLLTPSCGLAGLTEELSEHALSLLSDLSKKIRSAEP